MTKYLLTNNDKDCYGCRACEQICPQHAISIKPNEEGFLYPVLEANKCVNCGLCVKVCPIENVSETNTPIAVYAAQFKNEEELLESSSGGVFSALAEYILLKNGYVAGCVFDNNLVALHILTSDKDEVKKMRGSKYVQSDTGNIYTEIRNFLESEKLVLFTGTPCQVDGLRRYLRKDYDNLVTVDLICHGVPSPRLLSNYLTVTTEKKGRVSSLRFRDKKRNGWCSQGSICCNGKIKTISPYNNSYYYYYYLQNSVSRMCCYSCKYSSVERTADITIGDYWNIEDIISGIDTKNGFSALLINTAKGERILNAIYDKMYLYETSLDEVVRGNGNLSSPSKLPVQRKAIYLRIEQEGWTALEKTECKYNRLFPFVSKYIPKRIKKFLKKVVK